MAVCSTYWHTAGAHPCGQVAFVGPSDLLTHDGTQPPTVMIALVSAGGILEATSTVPMLTCSRCDAVLSRGDVRRHPYPLASVRTIVYIQRPTIHAITETPATDRRRLPRGGRRVSDINLNASSGKDVTIGAIAKKLGIGRATIREAAEHGEIPNAFRAPGLRAEWRVPFLDAVRYIRRITGHYGAEKN